MTYEITQAINLGNQITEYLSSAMIDNRWNGNKQLADQQAIDCCLVRSLVKSLEFYNLNGADTEMTDTDIWVVISKINEYEASLLLDVNDYAAAVGSESDALGGGSSIIVIGGGGGTVSVPVDHVYNFTVASNGQTVFTMPFDVAQVSTASLYLTLNGSLNPTYGDGYTMSGTTLTWTGAYPLSAGWTFQIKYAI